jgi:endoglucanase
MKNRLLPALAVTVVLITLFISFNLKAITGIDSTNKTIKYDPLPQEKQGKFPIMIPKYDGVEQLLVLSNKWVIVATTNIDEVVKMIDLLSEGKYLTNLLAHENKRKQGGSDWPKKKEADQLRDKYLAQARELAGEKQMDNTSFYQITSPNDPNYKEPQQPKRVTRFIVSLGEGAVLGGIEVHYAQYSYLEFPFPMVNGSSYTITLANKKSVTFTFDEMTTVSRAIKVNQVGYLPDSKQKFAYLSGYLQEFGPLDFSSAKKFYVVNANTGNVAFTGDVKLRSKNFKIIPKGAENDPNKQNWFSGEDIYEMDFTPLKEEGEFFISVPGVGRSWTFRHAADAYGEAFYNAVRGLFHQRCGLGTTKEFSAWTKPKCHIDIVYESEHIPLVQPISSPKDYNTFDVIGGSINYTRKTENAFGGWHDAADWDRNITHYTDIFDLLNAYELNPNRYFDGQLHIPESTNKIPDILDEAEFGLRIWKKSQTPDGGVAGAVETWTHAPMDDKNAKYAFSRRTTWSSLMYATAAAQYAYNVAPFNPQLAKEYGDSAQRAYLFGTNPTNVLKDLVIHAKHKRGQGDAYTLTFNENPAQVEPFLLGAKLRLYILTQDKEYLKNVPELFARVRKPFEHPFNQKDFSAWLYFSMLTPELAKLIPAPTLNALRSLYIKKADGYVKDSQENPYRASWPSKQDFWMAWGNTVLQNQARVLLIAYYLTKDQKYRDTAINNLDFMLGANPMGMSWTTGLGYVYPIEIQHEVSWKDGIMDPVPGITIYGITEGMPSNITSVIWKTKKPDGSFENFMNPLNAKVPIWRRWMSHPRMNVGQNEFTIHETMGAPIFDYGMLLPEGWMPSPQLMNKNPRKDEFLFGFWYLP